MICLMKLSIPLEHTHPHKQIGAFLPGMYSWFLPGIYPFIHPAAHPSIHPSIRQPPILPPNLPFLLPYMHSFLNPPIHSLFHTSVYPSNHPNSNDLSTHRRLWKKFEADMDITVYVPGFQFPFPYAKRTQNQHGDEFKDI